VDITFSSRAYIEKFCQDSSWEGIIFLGGGMLSRQYIPVAPLSSFIRCFWYADGTATPHTPLTHTRERLLPNGEFSMVFNLVDEPIRLYDSQDLTRCHAYGGAVLSGARANCFAIDTSQQERVLGIQFRPGGAFPFLGMPASEAEGISIALTDLWPQQAGELREQVLAARSVPGMFTILERFLLWRLRRASDYHPAVTYALQQFRRTDGAFKILRVTEQIGLSARRFTELFHKQVGLTPKVFTRVLRFQNVLQALRGETNPAWAELALRCGFYDQAHFIHEFQTFSGLTPTAYRQVATPHLNHVPIVSL
jgi:AraC-like DNA-binding protein